MSEARLPAHLEVAALIRAVESAGGFATVLAKGDRDAGVILLLTMERGRNARLWERMPKVDGTRIFEVVRAQGVENEEQFQDYLDRRKTQDADSWLVELDVLNAERLIAELGR